MKLFIEAPFSKENRDLIVNSAKGSVELTDNPLEAEIFLGGSLPANTYLPNLKFLQLCFAGAEKYCYDRLTGDDVVIANAKGAFGDVISEYVVGAVLMMYRDFFDYKENQRQKKWADLRRERMLIGEKAMILGCGNIGSAVAKRLKPFGTQIVGIRKNPRSTEFFDEVYGIGELEEQLKSADLIVCCLPKTPLTEGLLSVDKIALMKENALLVNVGRGALIDTEALVDALKEKRIYGAVLDVFEEEPLPETSPLWDLPNVFLTPHISGVSFGHSAHTERLIAKICAENVRRFLGGEQLLNVIDRKRGY